MVHSQPYCENGWNPGQEHHPTNNIYHSQPVPTLTVPSQPAHTFTTTRTALMLAFVAYNRLAMWINPLQDVLQHFAPLLVIWTREFLMIFKRFQEQSLLEQDPYWVSHAQHWVDVSIDVQKVNWILSIPVRFLYHADINNSAAFGRCEWYARFVSTLTMKG